MLTPPLWFGDVVTWLRAPPAGIRAVWDRNGGRLWVVGTALALLTLVGAGLTIWDTHRRTLEDANSDLRTLGIVLAAQTTRYVEVIDLLLRESQTYARQLDIGTPQAFRQNLASDATHQYLVARTHNLPQAHALVLVGADGTIVNTSRDIGLQPKIDVTDRDYFRHARDHADGGLFVSVPSIARSTGILSVMLSRRISGPDGGFLGVAIAAVDVDYLLDFYRTITHERRFSVTLVRSDGVVLARYPADAVPGQSIPSASPWYASVAAGGGLYRSPGYFTGVAAFISVNPLREYPLVLDVTIRESDVLATWRYQATYTACGAILLAGAWVALCWLTARQMRRQRVQNVRLSHTADALRSSEARLRDFAELASDWFWEQDADLRFVSSGAGAPQSPVHDRSHLGKRRWEIIDTSRDPERWEQHKRDVLAHLPFRDFRFEQRDASDRIYYMSISGTPAHDETGAFTGYRGIGRDMTAQIGAEQELERAKERAERAEALLQDAIDSIDEGFVIYDADDRLLTCNEGYRRLFSTVPTNLVPGVRFTDVLRDGLAGRAYPAAIGREEAWLEQVLRRHHEARSEEEMQLQDGSWVLVTNRHMRDGGIAGLRIDITALKQAQAALRDSEARLDRAQEIADIGSWELELASGKYVWSRHLYRIRGMPLDFQPTRESILASIDTEDHQPLSEWLADLQSGHERPPIEVRSTRGDADVRVLRVEARPVIDPDGVVRRLAGTTQDITERRLIERQLTQAQKMEAIGNLTGGMAHDFNNVLGVVIGNLDLLKRLVRPDAAASELCGEALDGATRAAELIRRLLAFARRQSLRPQRIDVNVLVGDIGRLLGRTLGEGNTLTLTLGAPLWPVVVDPVQLEAALVNLANNARDAMPHGGQLDITTRNAALDACYTGMHPDVRPGDYALIEITDTGTGIPPEIISRIFEPFFTTKAPGQGTGLGLAMTFGFVKQSEGHLAVYSEPGLGTTFRLYLPRNEASQAVPASVADSGTPDLCTPDICTSDVGSPAVGTPELCMHEVAMPGVGKHEIAMPEIGVTEIHLPEVGVPYNRAPIVGTLAGGNETVLVVEDDVRLRRAAVRQLAELGFHALQAEHAAAALAILAGDDQISLLFTDVVMPGAADGIGLARQATRLRPGLKVLLTSGFPNVRGSDLRAVDCPFPLLTKPYRRDELAKAVCAVLERNADQPTADVTLPEAWHARVSRAGDRLAIVEQV